MTLSFRLLSFPAALLAATTLFAQPAGRPAVAQAALALDTAYTGDTSFEARGGSAGGASVTQFGVKLSVPVSLPVAGVAATAGVSYRDYTLDCDAFTPIPDRLKSLSVSLSAFRAPVNDWSYFGSLSLGAHEAGSGFSSHGLGVSVVGLANRALRPGLAAGIGFVYNSLSRRHGRILPVATIDWRPAPTWRAFLGFPRSGISWQAAPEVEVDFVVEADFGAFYVQDDPAPLRPNRPALNRTRLDYQALRVGPAVTWRATRAFTVRAAAGLVPMLDVEYRQRGYELEADGVTGFASLSGEVKF
jgi:hypothetical protein